MKLTMVTLLSVLAIGLTVHAESAKEKFDRINAERAQGSFEEGQRAAILSGIKTLGIDTSNMKLQLDGNTFHYASDGKFACEFAVYMFFDLDQPDVNNESAFRKWIDQTYKRAIRCEKISSSSGTPKEDYQLGFELRREREFVANARTAIRKAGANPDEFTIPSDFRIRESVESPLWTSGLYLEGTNSICKLTSHMQLDVAAQCIKK